ncbi:MAG: nucleotidyl transferase AbiEii/AbiGii toxin family protein [Coprobacillus sp.]|nr:nucleotidyl transferase AbiEii/AbiGii toxin family protein [Coprobacillus sp.]
MRAKDDRSLKDLAANLEEKTHVSRDIIIKNYMMERLLARLSVSKYRDLFIIKGGYLISSMVGMDIRSTQDLDSTFVGSKVPNDELVKMFEEIMNIDIGDEIRFEIIKNKTIQINEPNEGVRITFNALYHNMKINFKIDITSGDYVSFKGVDYEFPMMFDDGTISIMSYTLETILAEKIEAILMRNVTSTRMRDYYDV